MVVFPHCKINLGLHVISKREDGYHNLETCFYPVPWTDILEIIPSREFSFSQSGLIIPGNQQDNLCIKAYQLLQNNFGIGPVKIHLHKILPTGAGLGGGSSDGAFTLRLLNQLFGLQLSVEQMVHYAALLGSDCAFFIEDKPKIGTGRGEQLSQTAISLKDYYLVLVKPDIHVSTAEAYRGVVPAQPSIALADVLKTRVNLWPEKLINDFEKSVFARYPAIKSLKEDMYSHGALYASMSGSGASVFGIFEKPIEFKATQTNMQVWSGLLE